MEQKSSPYAILPYGVIGATIYLLLAYAFPLLRYASRPRLYDLMRLTGRSIPVAMVYAALIALLFALYWLAYRVIRSAPAGGLLPVLLCAGAFAFLTVWMYPINATDLFQYFFRSRILLHYHSNPLAVSPGTFASDPYLYVVGEWTDIGSPYGPAWELLAALPALLTGGRLIPNLLALKGLSALFYAGCAALVYAILGRIAPARRVEGMLLFTWNPLILMEWIGNGHNDSVMLFFILLGVWLWVRGRYAWVLPAFAVAALIKAIAALPLPFFIVAIWNAHDQRGRVRSLGSGVLISIVTVVLLFIPFGLPWENVGGVLNEATSRYGFSFAATLVLVLRHWVVVPLIEAFDLSVHTRWLLLHYAYLVPRWLAFGALAWWYWRLLDDTWRRGKDPVAAGAEAFFAYLILAPSYRMWYPAWTAVLAALRPGEGRMLRAGLACMMGELSVLSYGYLSRWGLLTCHLVGTAYTLLLPAVAPWLVRSLRIVMPRATYGHTAGPQS